MSSDTQDPAIDHTTLTSIVRKVLCSDTVKIADWRTQPLYGELGGGGKVNLISGVGRDREEPVEWSVVLKIASAPPLRAEGPTVESGRNVSDYNYWKREPLIYQSGLLSKLSGGLTAPRCYGVVEQSENTAWIWLEAISDTVGPSWSLERYGIAARHLGQFNGANLAGEAARSHVWLRNDWLSAWVNRWLFMIEIIKAPRIWEHSLTRRAFPIPVRDKLLTLWAERSVLINALRRLPQTFCHGDANRSNLFARDAPGGLAQTVAVDWAFARTGAVGEEIAQFTASSLLRVRIKVSDMVQLDEVVFAGYLEGLRDAGWPGDPRIARLGYAASAALRWGIPGLFGLAYALVEDKHAEAERKFGLPIEELMEQWGKVVYFLLDLANEARDLLVSL
jgi:hypothetical protein